MLNVMAVDDYKVFMTQLKRLDFWKNNTQYNLVCTFTDSTEALSYLRENHIDILITDIKMPKIDGLELLTYVRKENLCPCTILLSEYAEFEYARKGIVLGAFDYIIKPVVNDSFSIIMNRAKSFLESQSTEDTSSLVDTQSETMAECIINSAKGFESKAENLVSICAQSVDNNFVRNGVLLGDTAVAVHKAVCTRYKWVEGLVLSPDTVHDRILQADDISASESFLVGFLRDMYVCVKQYHPKGMCSLVETVTDYILANSNERLSLSDVAEACYVNKTHLSHIFKQNMEISFVDYVVKYKMNLAKMMIIQTDQKLSDIATCLGYEDYKYMGRLFKNIYGITPSEYKKMFTG